MAIMPRRKSRGCSLGNCRVIAKRW